MAKLDLMGVAEIAQLIGVSPGRTHTIIKTDANFPEPAADLAVGRIWEGGDVRDWARNAGYPKRRGSEQ